MLPLSCGTILKAVDLASGSPSGPSAASLWVKVMGSGGLGNRCKLWGEVEVVPSMTTNHAKVSGQMKKTSEQEGT